MKNECDVSEALVITTRSFARPSLHTPPSQGHSSSNVYDVWICWWQDVLWQCLSESIQRRTTANPTSLVCFWDLRSSDPPWNSYWGLIKARLKWSWLGSTCSYISSADVIELQTGRNQLSAASLEQTQAMQEHMHTIREIKDWNNIILNKLRPNTFVLKVETAS